MIVILAALAGGAPAADFQVLLDLDASPATGCAVATPDGLFEGAEQVVITTVDTGVWPPLVTGVSRQVCSAGSLVDDLGFVPSAPLAWPVGPGVGTGGTYVLETYAPLPAVPQAPYLRVGFVSHQSPGGAADAMITGDGSPSGPDILIPWASATAIPALDWIGVLALFLALATAGVLLLRRRHATLVTCAVLLCAAAVVWAAVIERDGAVGDWIGVPQVASDPDDDAGGGVDLVAAFAQIQNGRLDVRLDFAGNRLPTADAQTVSTDEDTSLPITLTGTDPDGDPLAFAVSTSPSHGGLSGTPPDVTYMPDADFNGADSFTFAVDDGNGGSDGATISITVSPVNDPPVVDPASFQVPEDAAVGSAVGTVTFNDPDSGQSYIFALTAGNTGEAFAVDPASGEITVAAPLDFESLSSYAMTVQVSDDGSPVLSGSNTVEITVTGVDDPPVAAPDAATVTEDDPATIIDVLANDSDQDGGPMSVQSVTQPANGTAAVSGGGTGVAYTPAANYCNDGSPFDTFAYTLNGGSTAIVSVTVTCVDDPPLAVADAATVSEDSGANPIDVLLNDSDIDAGPRMVALVENPSTQGGTVLITGGGSGVSYAPASDACNTPPGTSLDTFTYTLNGGSSAIVTVSVTCVNDPPLIDLDGDDDKGTGGSDFASTFTEGGAATLLEDPTADATGAVITDIDSTTLVSLTATLTNLLDVGGETLDADVSAFPAIVKTYDTTTPGVGVLTLASLAPQAIADFVAVLRTVTYVDSSASPDATPRVVHFVANDGTSDGNTATSTVTMITVDNPPAAVADAATVGEDSAAATIDVLANDTDVDGGTKAIQSVTQPANGAVVITNAGADLTYAPDADYCNDGSPLDTFTYTLNGGSTATVSVTVTCVDDPPAAVDDAATVAEDSGAGAIDVLANDTDVDGGTKAIQSVTQPTNGSVAITGGGTGLAYAPTLDYCNNPPGTTLDTFTYSLNGGSSATVGVTVTCVDDPPAAVADAATVTEDSGVNAIDVLANDTDVDGGAKAIQSATQPANGTVAITGGGTGLTYAPTLNYCNNPPGVTPATFTYTLNGGSSTTVSVTVTCVNDPPVAGADAFDFIGNTEIEVDQDTASGPKVLATTASGLGVLDNDSDPVEGDTISIVGIVGCGDLTPPFDCTIAGAGTVTLNADGTFRFVPLSGDPDATESFQYLLSDGTSTATGTVTLTRFARVWYVDNSAGGGGDGTSAAPFNTITQANLSDNDSDGDLTDDLDGPNDYIFVHFGTGTTAGQSTGLVLENDQHLIGEHSGLSLNVSLNGNAAPATLVAASPGNRPLLDDTLADGFDGVSARNVVPAEIAGMSLAGDVNGIDWTTTAAFAGSGAFEIRDTVVRAAGAEGVDVNLAGSGAVSLAFHDNTLTATTTALDVQETGTGSLTITAFDDNVVSGNTGGSGIVVNNAIFDAVPGSPYQQVPGGTTVIGASGNGVGVAGMVMTSVTGDLAFTDLDIYADGGAGLQIGGTGAVNVGAGTGTRVTVGAGVSTVAAVGGPAVSLSSVTAGLPLSRLSSTNSPTTGVSLQNVVDGTSDSVFSAGSLSEITSAAGTAFNVDGGNATISFAGTISNSAGRSVSVTNRTADSLTLAGAITDTGTGISLASNTNSTIGFTGTLSLTTGSNTAFAATGGGTVSATDTANTITTTTGTALNVANTTIGPQNLEFRSISAGTAAGGPVNGIVLNATGTNGGLKVRGTGAAGSGGTIQGTTGDGISLTATANVELASMVVTAAGDDGIDGSSVTNFALTGCSVTNNGNAANEEGISLSNLDGAATLSNVTATGNAYNNLLIDNTTGVLSSLSVSGGSYSNNLAAIGNHGILVRARGTSAITTATVSGTTIAGNRSIGVQVVTGDTASVASFTISGNTIQNNQLGIDVSKAQTSNLTFNIQNNLAVTGHNSHAINLFTAAGAGTTGGFRGRLQNNTIGNAAVAGSGSAIGNGIRVNINGDADADVLIDGNTIRQCPNGRGIEVTGRNGTGGLDVTVTNNDANPQDASGFPLAAIVVQSNCATICNTVRSDVRANTVPAGATSDLLPTFIAVVETGSSTSQLVDSPPANANCTAQLTSTNTGSASASAGCALIAGPINTPP